MKSGVTRQSRPLKEFYTEVPFEIELDSVYSMLGFFDRVGKLERIVNVLGSGFFDAQAERSESKEDLSVRANGNGGGDVHNDNLFQS